MKVKKHCNCPTENLTQQSYNDLLFEALQGANKDEKDRCIVFINGNITHFNYSAAQELNFKIYAIVRAGLNNLNDVEHLERPI